MSRIFARKFSSKSGFWTPSKTIAYSTGAFSAAFISYLMLRSSPTQEEDFKLRKLPDVERISLDKMNEIFKKNERTLVSSNLGHRIDLNSIGCNDPMEDRHSESEFSDGYLVAVYDGHSGYQCAELAQKYLAAYCKDRILRPRKHSVSEKDHIIAALQDAFVSFDNDLINGSLQVEKTSPWSWNPFHKSTEDYLSIVKNLQAAKAGACAIIAFIQKENVYVASTGDCRAVIGRKKLYNSNDKAANYNPVELSEDHTLKNTREYSRLLLEHPGEDETVVARGRVLGGLMPTRTLGDARYKWTEADQNVILPHIMSKGARPPRNFKTPPYITALPEVKHYLRDENDDFLIVACDGLWDDISSAKAAEYVGKLVSEGYTANYSTALMKASLSGYEVGVAEHDNDRLAHQLSIPAPHARRYRDDLTASVILFKPVKQNQDIKSTTLEKVPDMPNLHPPQLKYWVEKLKAKTNAKL